MVDFGHGCGLIKRKLCCKDFFNIILKIIKEDIVINDLKRLIKIEIALLLYL